MNDGVTLEQTLIAAANDEAIVEPQEAQPEEAQPEAIVEPQEAQPEEAQPEDKKKNPMKEVRDKYNTEKKTREHIQTTINRYTDGDYDFKLRDFKTDDGSIDYDALNEKMDEADNASKAAQQGVSPEVQAEIDRIEKEKTEIRKQRLQIAMDKAINTLTLERQLKDADINNFFKDAMAVNMNPYRWLAQGGNLSQLYNTIYFERLVKAERDAAVEEAKAKWEATASKSTKAPNPNPATPTKSQTAGSEDGVSLATLLEEASKIK